ncbi:hypothetical protein WJX77_008944 [Trebouxia sp. C0004]
MTDSVSMPQNVQLPSKVCLQKWHCFSRNPRVNAVRNASGAEEANTDLPQAQQQAAELQPGLLMNRCQSQVYTAYGHPTACCTCGLSHIVTGSYKTSRDARTTLPSRLIPGLMLYKLLHKIHCSRNSNTCLGSEVQPGEVQQLASEAPFPHIWPQSSAKVVHLVCREMCSRPQRNVADQQDVCEQHQQRVSWGAEDQHGVREDSASCVCLFSL